MKKKRAVIIGAGVTGLAVAHDLSGRGWMVEVFEKESYVGGLATTFHRGKYSYDLGPHKLYTQIETVDKRMKKILADEIVVHPKSSSIRFFGEFLDYPIKITQLLRKMTLVDIVRFGLDYLIELLRSLVFRKEPRNSQEYFVTRFGTTAYEKMFKPLFEKVYGPPSVLDADLARTRVPFPSMFWAVIGSLIKKNDPKLSA